MCFNITEFGELENLPSLRALSLDGCHINVETMKSIEMCTSLKFLSMENSHIPLYKYWNFSKLVNLEIFNIRCHIGKLNVNATFPKLRMILGLNDDEDQISGSRILISPRILDIINDKVSYLHRSINESSSYAYLLYLDLVKMYEGIHQENLFKDIEWIIDKEIMEKYIMSQSYFQRHLYQEFLYPTDTITNKSLLL